MSKRPKVSLTPNTRPSDVNLDDFVSGATPPAQPEPPQALAVEVAPEPAPEPEVVVRKVRVTVDLDEDVHLALKIHSARQKCSMADIIRTLVAQELEQA